MRMVAQDIAEYDRDKVAVERMDDDALWSDLVCIELEEEPQTPYDQM